MSSDGSSSASGMNYVGAFAGRACFVLFLLLIFVMGAWVAGVGFHDPDTCWLLALGRHIVEHGALPSADPFSYTYKGTFVLYQWLTEVILYLAYKLGGLLGILCLVALTVIAAFVLVPLSCFDRLKLSRVRALGLIVLGFTSAAFHLLVRPEIFSYLLLSIWLSLFSRLRAEPAAPGASINWRLVAAFGAVMFVWSNVHTAFTGAFIILTVYTVANCFVLIWRRGDFQFPLRLCVIVLVTSILATLLNPRGMMLWAYIPNLFFGGFNKHIVELAPLSLRDLTDPEWYPFFILAAVAIKSCWRAVRSCPKGVRQHADSIVLIAVFLYLAASHHRLVSFNALTLIYECAWLRSQVPESKRGSLYTGCDAALRTLIKPDKMFAAVAAGLALFGCFAVATGPVKPHLPQASKAFEYPAQVIKYMGEHPAGGRGFNAPQLGDVMIWQLESPPKVFIDTRFDMYGVAIVDDYETIAYCKPGWEQLFRHYDFDWLFINSKEPLAHAVSGSREWQVFAEDPGSVYMRRQRQGDQVPDRP